MICLVVSLLLSLHVSGEVLEDIQEGIRLTPFTSYRSVALVGFDVKEKSVFSTWLIKAYSKPLHCPARNVTVYLQQGGYPFVRPHNEAVPEQFYTQRTNLYNQTFLTKGQIVAFRMLNPRPGPWYAAIFLKDLDKEIRQKGLSTSCTYYASVSHVSPSLEVIPDVTLSPDTTLYHVTLNKTTDKHLIRYLLPKGVYRYDVTVSRCIVGTVDMTDIGCPVRLHTSGDQLPGDKSSRTNCSQFTTSACKHAEHAPEPLVWNYLGLYVLKSQNIELTFNLTYKACRAIIISPKQPEQRLSRTASTLTDPVIITALNKTADNVVSTEVEDDDVCTIQPLMDQSRIYNDYFTYTFLMSSPNKQSLVTNLTDTITVFPFEMDRAAVDGGGTLTFSAKVGPLKDRSQNVSITWCMTKNSLPVNHTGLKCVDGLILRVNTSTGVGRQDIHVPYPEGGRWYIAGKRDCYVLDREQKATFVDCISNVSEAALMVHSAPCLNDQCGPHGGCRTFYSGVYFFTACTCYSGYRGYTCNDGSAAAADSEELVEMLLLVLSNLAFIPASAIAFHRRYFVQGIVYLFTMCFSSIYHMCDRTTRYTVCLLSYDVLSYCDFYGSILSACVTIIAMSKLNEPIRSILLINSCLFLAFSVAYDRHSLWVFGVPVLVLLAVMFTAWGVFCRSRHSCYPSMRRYFTHIIPGAACALLGVLLFGLVETTENYPYIHSAWHALMAMSVMLVLPPRATKTNDSQESLLIGLNSQKTDDARSNDVRLFVADQPNDSGDSSVNDLI